MTNDRIESDAMDAYSSAVSAAAERAGPAVVQIELSQQARGNRIEPHAGELRERGLGVVTVTSYRMAPVANLSREVYDAFAAHRIAAALHYSRRSARAFLDAVRIGGVEISALAVPQCCISGTVASILRDAGAPHVVVARAPAENAVFEVLDRVLQSVAR